MVTNIKKKKKKKPDTVLRQKPVNTVLLKLWEKL